MTWLLAAETSAVWPSGWARPTAWVPADRLGAGRTAAAAAVVHDEALPEQGMQLRRQQPGGDVIGAARGEGHDQRHRACRPVGLGARGVCGGGAGEERRALHQKSREDGTPRGKLFH
jgi:hypothetical protein